MADFYTPFQDRRVISASATRSYPESCWPEFLKELNLPPESLVQVKQIHTDQIVIVDSLEEHAPETEADALITAVPGITLGIRTADCIPVFIWDAFQDIIALVHAGWRGVKAEIIPKTIARMAEEFGSKPSTLQTALGPSIRKCCYEVGGEFADIFPKHYCPPKEKGKGFMDLSAEAKDQLLQAGVPASFIFDSGICTVCQNNRYFSARTEKTQERILSVLYLR